LLDKLIDQLLFKPSETILDNIAKMGDQEVAREGVKGKKATLSWMHCPGCGSTVLEELLDKGCYVCGWSPADPEHEQGVERASFKVVCLGCGTTVVREQLVESGCYICGWRPADENGV